MLHQKFGGTKDEMNPAWPKGFETRLHHNLRRKILISNKRVLLVYENYASTKLLLDQVSQSNFTLTVKFVSFWCDHRLCGNRNEAEPKIDPSPQERSILIINFWLIQDKMINPSPTLWKENAFFLMADVYVLQKSFIDWIKLLLSSIRSARTINVSPMCYSVFPKRPAWVVTLLVATVTSVESNLNKSLNITRIQESSSWWDHNLGNAHRRFDQMDHSLEWSRLLLEGTEWKRTCLGLVHQTTPALPWQQAVKTPQGETTD